MSFVCPSKYPNDGSAVQHMNWLFEMPTNMPFLVKILSRHLKPGYLSMSCGKIHTLAPPIWGSAASPTAFFFFAIITIQPRAFRFFQVRGRHQVWCSWSLSWVQLFVTPCCSPPGFSVHGIFQERILKWVPFSRGSSWPRHRTQASCIAGKFSIVWASRDTHPGHGPLLKLQGTQIKLKNGCVWGHLRVLSGFKPEGHANLSLADTIIFSGGILLTWHGRENYPLFTLKKRKESRQFPPKDVSFTKVASECPTFPYLGCGSDGGWTGLPLAAKPVGLCSALFISVLENFFTSYTLHSFRAFAEIPK